MSYAPMNIKNIYSRPETESEESVFLQAIIQESNTETYEGKNDDDLTW